jgi:hypothetical protein
MIEVIEQTGGSAHALILQRNIFFLSHGDLLMPYTENGFANSFDQTDKGWPFDFQESSANRGEVDTFYFAAHKISIAKYFCAPQYKG